MPQAEPFDPPDDSATSGSAEEPATEEKPAAEDVAENGTPEDPAAQIGEQEGGAPGDAPPEQVEDGTSAENTGKDAAAGEDDPTVQTGESAGGHTDETASSEGTTEAGKWGVTWFNKAAL